MSNQKKKHKPAHGKKHDYSFWLWCLMIVLVGVGVSAGFYFASSSLFDKPQRRQRPTTSYTPTETLLVAKDKTTVMIMGVDERKDDIGRSDTLMIATVDPKKKNASLLSIPRDTRVEVPGYGYDKINVAYSLGGHSLTQDTVEEFLDTPIEHYVLIKVPAFKRIIDAIGGVDIDVEKRMFYEDEWDDDGGLVIDLYPGLQHMDGATAITYVRYRDEEGDIGRVHRQQKFMKAVMDQVISPSIITRLPEVIREVMTSVDTDLSFRQILELVGALKEAQSNGLKTKMVSGRPMYIDEISYWIPDVYDTREEMADMLGISISQSAKREMERDASAYEASIPSDATDVPEEENTVGRVLRGDTKPSAAGDRESVTAPSGRRQGKGSESGDSSVSPSSRPSVTPSRPETTTTTGSTRPETTEKDAGDEEETKPAATEAATGSSASEESESRAAESSSAGQPAQPSRTTPSRVPSPSASGSKTN